MVDFKVSVDEDMLDVLKAMAKIQGTTVEEVLHNMLAQSIDELKERMNDPMIGLLSSGEGDISERDEEILYSGWQPD